MCQVRLAGRDEEGRPVVVMHLGPALRLPRDKAAGFVVAIISVVDIVVTGLLGDEPGHPENLTTVLDVAGCGMMQVSSSVGVMKQVLTPCPTPVCGRVLGFPWGARRGQGVTWLGSGL